MGVALGRAVSGVCAGGALGIDASGRQSQNSAGRNGWCGLPVSGTQRRCAWPAGKGGSAAGGLPGRRRGHSGFTNQATRRQERTGWYSWGFHGDTRSIEVARIIDRSFI